MAARNYSPVKGKLQFAGLLGGYFKYMVFMKPKIGQESDLLNIKHAHIFHHQSPRQALL